MIDTNYMVIKIFERISVFESGKTERTRIPGSGEFTESSVPYENNARKASRNSAYRLLRMVYVTPKYKVGDLTELASGNADVV